MKTPAAVALAPKQPRASFELSLDDREARVAPVEIMATGIDHTDACTLDGLVSGGIFPSGPRHEGAGTVRDVGPGVTSLTPGIPMIPLGRPEGLQTGLEQGNERFKLVRAGTSIRSVGVF